MVLKHRKAKLSLCACYAWCEAAYHIRIKLAVCFYFNHAISHAQQPLVAFRHEKHRQEWQQITSKLSDYLQHERLERGLQIKSASMHGCWLVQYFLTLTRWLLPREC